MSAKTIQLLSSGEFCKLRYDTIPVKSASANVSFYTNNSKMPNFELWHSCRKWTIRYPSNHKVENTVWPQLHFYVLCQWWPHGGLMCPLPTSHAHGEVSVKFSIPQCLLPYFLTFSHHGSHTYRVIQEESALLWEMIVWVILSKKVHTNMGPILNSYGVMTAWNLE